MQVLTGELETFETNVIISIVTLSLSKYFF